MKCESVDRERQEWHTVDMPKRAKKKRPRDLNLLAASIVQDATGEKAIALGQLGGKKGGPARAQKLSPERRREIAQNAARARWRR